MKIRLMGTEDECRAVAGRLAEITDVLEVDGPRANRGGSRQVRMYAEVRVSDAAPDATDQDRAYARAAVAGLSEHDRSVILAWLTGYAPREVLQAVGSVRRHLRPGQAGRAAAS